MSVVPFLSFAMFPIQFHHWNEGSRAKTREPHGSQNTVGKPPNTVCFLVLSLDIHPGYYRKSGGDSGQSAAAAQADQTAGGGPTGRARAGVGGLLANWRQGNPPNNCEECCNIQHD